MICFFIAIFLPIIIGFLGIPLAFRLVKPNISYGIRTKKTLSSDKYWYDYNQRAGKYMFMSGILGLFFTLTIWLSLNLDPQNKLCLSLLINIILIVISVFGAICVQNKYSSSENIKKN